MFKNLKRLYRLLRIIYILLLDFLLRVREKFCSTENNVYVYIYSANFNILKWAVGDSCVKDISAFRWLCF